MKTAVSYAPPILAERQTAATLASGKAKAAAYVALVKPRLTTLVLLTVAVGFLLGARRSPDLARLLAAVVGTGLVAGGASAWNQYLERARDLLMKRTAGRPLPSGRLAPGEVVVFGTVLTLLGVTVLALGANPLAATVALATFVLYVMVYTPLKPATTLNTAVGAVPGALPPVIGWAAATGRLGVEAWALFLIVFLWQFPHFLAIAWIYRDDYARAGHKMLPSVDPTGAITGRQAVGYALALVPVGLLPTVVGLAGPLFFVFALLLGVFYTVYAVRFRSEVCDASARRLLRASFLYLPMMLLLLLLNPVPY